MCRCSLRNKLIMVFNASNGRELFIKKYLFTLLLILGLTIILSVYSASAANISSNSTNSTVHTTVKNASQLSAKTTSISTVSTTKVKTIKVLIYSGKGAINSCVSGVINCLHYSNNKNMVPGYKFSCGTTRTISSAKLSGYDVLVMPGGSSGLKYIQNIDVNAIKKFVSSGHGYVGICAGAYSGSKYVEGLYNGWGLAPHVYCKHFDHEGNLLVTTSNSVKSLLGPSKTVTLAHYNGPAMYSHGGSIVTFATYANNRYKGYKAIVGDYYCKGRTVLSGPHPELQPTNSNLLAKMVLWADHVNSINQSFAVSSTDPVNGAVNVAANKLIKVSYTKSVKIGNNNIQLKNSSGTVIPITITVSGSTITISHSLLTKGIKYTLIIGSGSVFDLSGNGLNSFSTSFRVSSLTTAQMNDGIKRVRAFIALHNRLPNYVTFGTMQIPIITFKEIISAYGLKI